VWTKGANSLVHHSRATRIRASQTATKLVGTLNRQKVFGHQNSAKTEFTQEKTAQLNHRLDFSPQAYRILPHPQYIDQGSRISNRIAEASLPISLRSSTSASEILTDCQHSQNLLKSTTHTTRLRMSYQNQLYCFLQDQSSTNAQTPQCVTNTYVQIARKSHGTFALRRATSTAARNFRRQHIKPTEDAIPV
jgi:hypothetical protein